MPLESRNKTISLRLTEKEYDRLHELCLSSGMRSVSEMTRAAIDELMRQPSSVARKNLRSRVNELEDRMNMLSIEIQRLNRKTQ